MGANVKNVIVFVGDGMGFNHLTAGEIHLGHSLSINRMPNKSAIQTYSLDNPVTDSAAGATALATGNKTNNGQIGRIGAEDVENITTIAQRSGKSTGIITTDALYGATPAGFSAHANSRYDTADIIASQLQSGVNLFIGNGGSRYDAVDPSAYASHGYAHFSSYGSFIGTVTSLAETGKALVATSTIGGSRTMQTVVETALNLLSSDTDGFFLMTEASAIDTNSHASNIAGMLTELANFDEAIAYAVQWASARDDTVIIVTADHETGGLTIGDGAPANSWYTSNGTHTGVDVPFFVYGAELKQSVYENTDVFDLCKAIMAR